MYNHILVALDGTPASDQALKQAISLARLTGASLVGLSVIEKLPAYAASVGEVQELKDEMSVFYRRVQARAVQVAQASGVEIKNYIHAGHAARVIIQFAEENRIDLIVLGTSGNRGLGGTADKVAENAHCSVLIVRLLLNFLKVKDVMTQRVVTVTPNTPLANIVELLLDQRLKAVPVVSEGKTVGIITGGDLLSRAGLGLRLSLQQKLPVAARSEQIQPLQEKGGIASDIMTAPVITIEETEDLTKAVKWMVDNQIKRLPVLSKSGELVGMISRFDILSMLSSSMPASELSPDIGYSPHTAGDLLIKDVPTVRPDTSVEEVINKIVATPLRRVVVTDDQCRVVGIITDADLLENLTPRQHPSGALQQLITRLSRLHSEPLNWNGPASSVMNRDVYTVNQDTPLVEVLQLMLEKELKRVVVVDEDRCLAGMVSRDDILRAVAYGIERGRNPD